ncbi:MAG: serine/threonine protein kinase, partial [Myxococcales bacterium]|nr:serine/threonine protein kinase [Myxococcales bacterium]
MEWLEGQTLRQRLREGKFSLTELRDVFAPLLSALEAAHGAGFVHRDLKP